MTPLALVLTCCLRGTGEKRFHLPQSGADEAKLSLCSPDFFAGFQSLQESHHFLFVDFLLCFLFERLRLLGGVPTERAQYPA